MRAKPSPLSTSVQQDIASTNRQWRPESFGRTFICFSLLVGRGALWGRTIIVDRRWSIIEWRQQQRTTTRCLGPRWLSRGRGSPSRCQSCSRLARCQHWLSASCSSVSVGLTRRGKRSSAFSPHRAAILITMSNASERVILGPPLSRNRWPSVASRQRRGFSAFASSAPSSPPGAVRLLDLHAGGVVLVHSKASHCDRTPNSRPALMRTSRDVCTMPPPRNALSRVRCRSRWSTNPRLRLRWRSEPLQPPWHKADLARTQMRQPSGPALLVN